MANTGFKVEPQRLAKSAEVVNNKVTEYNKEVVNIYSAIENLTVEWKGQTSDAFKQQIEGYRNDFNKLAEILTGYSNMLVTAANKYNSTDSKLAGDAKRLSVGK
jgi:WXG100 family type VII secretion target